MKKLFDAVLFKLGYVPEFMYDELDAKLHVVTNGVAYASRRITELEAEVDISRRVLSACYEARNALREQIESDKVLVQQLGTEVNDLEVEVSQLEEELSIVTTERDIAQGKVEDAQYRAYELEGQNNQQSENINQLHLALESAQYELLEIAERTAR